MFQCFFVVCGYKKQSKKGKLSDRMPFVCRKQLELHEGQQKIWDEELAPSQAGEETPDCQAVVSR